MTLVTSEDDYDNKSVTAMGVLETLQTVMGELEQSGEVSSMLMFLNYINLSSYCLTLGL